MTETTLKTFKSAGKPLKWFALAFYMAMTMPYVYGGSWYSNPSSDPSPQPCKFHTQILDIGTVLYFSRDDGSCQLPKAKQSCEDTQLEIKTLCLNIQESGNSTIRLTTHSVAWSFIEKAQKLEECNELRLEFYEEASGFLGEIEDKHYFTHLALLSLYETQKEEILTCLGRDEAEEKLALLAKKKSSALRSFTTALDLIKKVPTQTSNELIQLFSGELESGDNRYDRLERLVAEAFGDAEKA